MGGEEGDLLFGELLREGEPPEERAGLNGGARSGDGEDVHIWWHVVCGDEEAWGLLRVQGDGQEGPGVGRRQLFAREVGGQGSGLVCHGACGERSMGGPEIRSVGGGGGGGPLPAACTGGGDGLVRGPRVRWGGRVGGRKEAEVSVRGPEAPACRANSATASGAKKEGGAGGSATGGRSGGVRRRRVGWRGRRGGGGRRVGAVPQVRARVRACSVLRAARGAVCRRGGGLNRQRSRARPPMRGGRGCVGCGGRTVRWVRGVPCYLVAYYEEVARKLRGN